jgi:hypothetical protein
MEVEEPLVEKDAEYYDRYSRQYFTFGKQGNCLIINIVIISSHE